MNPVVCSTVIVSYNSRRHLPALLQDLRHHGPGGPVIVIDNASPDGTADLVQADFPEVKLVRNAANVGYAAAANQGFALCSTVHVFLLNPDIRIQDPQVFRALRRCLEDDRRVAVAGPLQFKDDGGRLRLNFTWSFLTPRAFPLYAGHLIGMSPSRVDPLPVLFLNAGCLYVRRTAFEAVAGFNEKYFLYGEEPDLFLKFARFGWECRLVPAVSVMHARDRSLHSAPPLRRARFRLQGAVNIADAVIRGVARIWADRLTGRSREDAWRE
jgi:N-acetylglucosaminyl-diphospho-decaprenol L-rhamnosyltransferase